MFNNNQYITRNYKIQGLSEFFFIIVSSALSFTGNHVKILSIF